MKKFLKALFVGIALALVPISAQAAPPTTSSGPVITLDAEGTSLPLAEVAADWSDRTGVRVVLGDCTGVNCIHFYEAYNTCGQSGPIRSIAGCTYRLDNGGCFVEVEAGHNAMRRLYTAKHETGHCIWSFSGATSISSHLDSSRALMGPTVSNPKNATLTSTDRRVTRGYWS